MNIFEALKYVGKEEEKSLQLLFDTHKEYFTSLVDAENKKNPLFKDLVYAFTDLKGKKYYRFAEGLALPLERVGKLQDLFMYINTGMSGAQWDECVNNIEQAIYNGLSKPEVAGVIGAQLKVIKEMRQTVFHTELLYNMAAVQLVREDESIVNYNNEIQLEKVNQFKLEVEKTGSFFFFHQTDLKTLRNYLELSQAEWTSLWHESEINQEQLSKINLYLKQSINESLSIKKNLKNT